MQDAEVMASYRLTMAPGLVAGHRNVLDDRRPAQAAHPAPGSRPVRRAALPPPTVGRGWHCNQDRLRIKIWVMANDKLNQDMPVGGASFLRQA